jgi:hypothetical protein
MTKSVLPRLRILKVFSDTRNTDEEGWTKFLAVHSDAMARKAKRRTRKSNRNKTDWAIGQPLVFPPQRNSISRLARETVADVINGPFKLNRQNPKKKLSNPTNKTMRAAAIIR